MHTQTLTASVRLLFFSIGVVLVTAAITLLGRTL